MVSGKKDTVQDPYLNDLRKRRISVVIYLVNGVRQTGTIESFDQNAVLLTARTLRARALEAGFAHVRIAYRLFFPGFLRALRPFERGLTRVPFGAQYYICATP